ncbi:Uncharacterized protein EJ110_NYTH39797 [Nymphaea thermarum]|nr:Uncharacterized protein EJ110_NYTH39797 [Nymphaea thermarum]
MVDGMSFSGMGNLYVQAVPPPDLNKNTEWFMYPGVWTTYILILFFSWLMVLSVFGCSPGMAWTIVNLCHFLPETQAQYEYAPWMRVTMSKSHSYLKYLIASHTTDYRNPWLFLNTVAVAILVIAKFPNMHKVRLFGINGDK